MSNRDLLKEAIADAKAVKEMAISNAKAALEEAFTPHLQTMLAKKLQEMEDEDEKMEEAKMKDEESMTEAELTELLDEINEEESEETMEEVEAPVAEAESEEKEEESEEEEEKEEEEIDLEEMSEEDLKAFIEDVVDEMIASGELEAGHEGMEDEAGAEEEETMTVDAEMGEESPAEMPMAEGDEELTEAFDPAMVSLSPEEFMMAVKIAGGTLASLVGGGAALANKEEIASALKKAFAKVKGGMGMKEAEEKEEKMHKMEEELEEAMATVATLKSELAEVNLLNSKLLYTNKIFKAKNLTESQKVKVLSTFDKAESVKEVKLVFETLSEGLATASPKELVKENKSFASKAVGTSPKQPVVETNDMVNRFKKLAGLK